MGTPAFYGNYYPGIPIQAFGAVGDGVTDDTAAFQKAWDVLSQSGEAVWLTAQRYRIGTVLCEGAGGFVHWRGESVNLDPDIAPGDLTGTVIELLDGVNASGFVFDDEVGEPYFENMALLGNQAGQASGTSYCFELPDAVSVSRAISLHRVRLERWRSGALAVGSNRNAGKLDHLLVHTNGYKSDGTPVASNGDGLRFGACNDWWLSRLNVGVSGRHGIYGVAPGTMIGSKINSYSNTKAGMRFDEGAGQVDFEGGSCDRNEEDGLIIVGSSATTRANRRRFSGFNFSGNSQAANDTHADVVVHNDPTGDTLLCYSNFDKSGLASHPKYCIETTGTTTGVRVQAPTYRTGGDAPYVTAFTNDVSKIIVT